MYTPGASRPVFVDVDRWGNETSESELQERRARNQVAARPQPTTPKPPKGTMTKREAWAILQEHLDAENITLVDDGTPAATAPKVQPKRPATIEDIRVGIAECQKGIAWLEQYYGMPQASTQPTTEAAMSPAERKKLLEATPLGRKILEDEKKQKGKGK